MLFALSDEGISGLRKLAKEIHQCSDALSQTAMILNSQALELSPMLGNYATSISRIVDEALSQSAEIKNAITILGESLFVKAQKMENMLEEAKSEDFNPARAILATGIATAGIVFNTMFPKLENESIQKHISPPTPTSEFVHTMFDLADSHNEVMDKKERREEAARLLQSAAQIRMEQAPPDD